jgi:hypothetical protein
VPSPELKSLSTPSEEIPLRKEFLSSLADVDNLEPATLKVFGMHPETDMALTDTEPVAEANFVHVQSVQMPQEERVQMVISAADEGKLITFGRSTQMYAVSGFLVDSNNASAGHLMTQWDRMYEKHFRLTACLKPRNIVQFRWRLSSFYGHLLSNIKGMEASAPSVCMVNFTFLSLYEDDSPKRKPIIELDDGDSIFGSASYESLTKLNLTPNLVEERKVAASETAVGSILEGLGPISGREARGGF